MQMRIFDFFTIVYDGVFILQLLAVSFSIVWIFYDWKKETKNIAIGIAYICGTFLVGTLLNWLLFALSTVWRAVAGIHFQIAWLLTIFLYLGIFDRTYVTSRFIIGATIFITAITTAEFGHELGGYLGSVYRGRSWDWICYLADLFMIGFALDRYSWGIWKKNQIQYMQIASSC